MSDHPGEKCIYVVAKIQHPLDGKEPIYVPTNSNYLIRSSYEDVWVEKPDKYTGLFLNLCSRKRGTFMNLGVLLSTYIHFFPSGKGTLDTNSDLDETHYLPQVANNVSFPIPMLHYY